MRPESHLGPPLRNLFLFMRLFFKKANRIIDNFGPISSFIAQENPDLIFLLQHIPLSHVGTSLGNETSNYSYGSTILAAPDLQWQVVPGPRGELWYKIVPFSVVPTFSSSGFTGFQIIPIPVSWL